MGVAQEIIIGRAVNPGATVTALTAGSGDSFAVRSFTFGAKAQIENLWAQQATAGVVRVRSPRLHDQVQGIRFQSPANLVRALLPDELYQPLYPQDVLIFEQSGGGAETDCAALSLYYADLPGVQARVASWEAILPRIVNLVDVEVDIANPTTAGDWSAGTAINATFDNLIANTDYAWLGYQSAATQLVVAMRGPDTGNLRVGGPGVTESTETRDWFISGSKNRGQPMIPVFNAANKFGTLLFVAGTTTGGTTNVSLTLAQLSPGAI